MNINEKYIVGSFILAVAVFISTLVIKEKFQSSTPQPYITIGQMIGIGILLFIAILPMLILLIGYMIMRRN